MIRSTIGVEDDCGDDPSGEDESIFLGISGVNVLGFVGATSSAGDGSSADDGFSPSATVGSEVGDDAGEGGDEFSLTVSLRDRNSSVSVDRPLDDALL